MAAERRGGREKRSWGEWSIRGRCVLLWVLLVVVPACSDLLMGAGVQNA